VQRKTLRFDRTSRSQVMAYFTRPCMAGAVEELAKRLKVPQQHYNRMKRVLKQHKKAHTGEHRLMQSILIVLSGRRGPYFLLDSMDLEHQRGLLVHMGEDGYMGRSGACSYMQQYCSILFDMHCAACRYTTLGCHAPFYVS